MEGSLELDNQPRCFYCDEQNCDHRHANDSSSCGDCCAIHGLLCIKCEEGYKWVERCFKAKNERIASIGAEVARLREALRFAQRVASGEQQVAEDDTEGMAWIDMYVNIVLE